MCMMMRLRGHSGHDAQAIPTAARQGESLLELLKRRYALGEITREQFEEIKHVLGVSNANSTNENTPLAKGVMK